MNQNDAHISNSARISVRRRGLCLLVIGAVLFTGSFAAAIFLLPYLGYEPGPDDLKVLAAPGAFALVGLVEFTTGVSFFQLAARWDGLKGWQRGVVGTVIVLVALGILLAIGAWVVARLD